MKVKDLIEILNKCDTAIDVIISLNYPYNIDNMIMNHTIEINNLFILLLSDKVIITKQNDFIIPPKEIR